MPTYAETRRSWRHWSWTQEWGSVRLNYPAEKTKIIDVVGAGDTFCGYFSSCIDQGKKLEEALILANNAAAIACTKVGAQNSIPMLRDII